MQEMLLKVVSSLTNRFLDNFQCPQFLFLRTDLKSWFMQIVSNHSIFGLRYLFSAGAHNYTWLLSFSCKWLIQ